MASREGLVSVADVRLLCAADCMGVAVAHRDATGARAHFHYSHASDTPQVASATFAKVLEFGTTVIFYGSVPCVLFLARSRRGLALADFARALRLPFVD